MNSLIKVFSVVYKSVTLTGQSYSLMLGMFKERTLGIYFCYQLVTNSLTFYFLVNKTLACMNPGIGSSAGLYDCEIDSSGYKERPVMHQKAAPVSESEKEIIDPTALSKFFPEDKNNNKVVTNW